MTIDNQVKFGFPRFHEAQIVTVDDQQALIDVPLVHLVENIWKLKIRTLYSCESQFSTHHGKDSIFISFNSIDDFSRLCHEVLNHCSNRVIKTSIKELGGGIISDSWNADIHNFRPEHGYAASLYFPKDQLSLVTEAIALAVKKIPND